MRGTYNETTSLGRQNNHPRAVTLTMDNEPPRNNTSLEQATSYVAAWWCSTVVIQYYIIVIMYCKHTLAASEGESPPFSSFPLAAGPSVPLQAPPSCWRTAP